MLCESVVAKEYDDGNAVVPLPVLCNVAISIGEVVEVKVVRFGDMTPPFIGKPRMVVIGRNSLQDVGRVILEDQQTVVCKQRQKRGFIK